MFGGMNEGMKSDRRKTRRRKEIVIEVKEACEKEWRLKNCIEMC